MNKYNWIIIPTKNKNNSEVLVEEFLKLVPSICGLCDAPTITVQVGCHVSEQANTEIDISGNSYNNIMALRNLFVQTYVNTVEEGEEYDFFWDQVEILKHETSYESDNLYVIDFTISENASMYADMLQPTTGDMERIKFTGSSTDSKVRVKQAAKLLHDVLYHIDINGF